MLAAVGLHLMCQHRLCFNGCISVLVYIKLHSISLDCTSQHFVACLHYSDALTNAMQCYAMK